MSKAVKKFLEAAKSAKAKNPQSTQTLMTLMLSAISASASAMTAEQIKLLGEQVKKLSKIILLQKVSEVKPFVGSLEEPPAKENDKDITRVAMMDALEKLITVKSDAGEKKFLLYRPTVDFEYEKCATPFGPADQQTSKPTNDRTSGDADMRPTEYQTHEDTTWLTTFFNAETLRHGANPIVAVWVPENQIGDVRGAQENKGTWGSLGGNPQADLVRVIVKPGKYQLYSELKS
jgi:hypothetical protein